MCTKDQKLYVFLCVIFFSGILNMQALAASTEHTEHRGPFTLAKIAVSALTVWSLPNGAAAAGCYALDGKYDASLSESDRMILTHPPVWLDLYVAHQAVPLGFVGCWAYDKVLQMLGCNVGKDGHCEYNPSSFLGIEIIASWSQNPR